MRWKIEVFHKILKSGFKAEASKLRTAERLTNLLAIFCLLGWRVFWITMIQRILPNKQVDIILTPLEQNILSKLLSLNRQNAVLTIADGVTSIAKIGGYLAQNNDPPPGNIVVWRGLSRLMDIVIGYQMAIQDVGN